VAQYFPVIMLPVYIWHTTVNSALHPSVVAKSSTTIGWSKGGKVTAAGWQLTLCDPMWHVISCSSLVTSITTCTLQYNQITDLVLWQTVSVSGITEAASSYYECAAWNGLVTFRVWLSPHEPWPQWPRLLLERVSQVVMLIWCTSHQVNVYTGSVHSTL